MLRVLFLVLLAGTVHAATDAKIAYAKIVALDTEFARVIRTNDLPRYIAAKQSAEGLVNTLGSDPTDPCRTAAVRLKTSRTNEWIERQAQQLSERARLSIQANRREFEEALAACKAAAP